MYKILLILHFIGLALGVGAAFANLTLGIASRKLAPEDRLKFGLHSFVLSKNGSIGLVLLLVSGIGMMLLRGVGATFAWGGPALHAKLTLVVLLMGALGYMQVLQKRARAENGGPALAKIPTLGRAMLLLGLGIIICAVIAFGQK